jgi:5-methylcytosine-specific restriction endonuclease McrA
MNEGHKVCPKCGRNLPETSEYFHRHGDGLQSACKQCRCAAAREYRKQNIDKVRAARRRWQVAHAEAMRLHRKKWRANHPERVLEYRREWTALHRDSRHSYAAARRAAEKGAIGSHTAEDVQAQLARQSGRCFYCGKKLREYQVDHVVPLALGGGNGPENLVLACPSCNLSKQAKHPMDWNGTLL